VNPETERTDPGTSHQRYGIRQRSGTSDLTRKLQRLHVHMATNYEREDQLDLSVSSSGNHHKLCACSSSSSRCNLYGTAICYIQQCHTTVVVVCNQKVHS